MDSGLPNTPREVLLPFLDRERRLHLPLALVITHMDADHCGGTANLKGIATAVTVVAHAQESPPLGDPQATLRQRYMPFSESDGLVLDFAAEERIKSRLGDAFQVDLRLVGNCDLSLGTATCTVVHLAGHTAGHLGLWLPQDRTLIAGDAFMGSGIRMLDGRVLFPPQFVRPSRYLTSIRFAQKLEPDYLLCAHEPTMTRQVAARFLDSSRSMAEAIMDQVAKSVSASSKTLLDVCHDVKLLRRDWDHLADSDFAVSVAGCLSEMEEDGRVGVRVRHGIRTFEGSSR